MKHKHTVLFFKKKKKKKKKNEIQHNVTHLSENSGKKKEGKFDATC